MSESSLKQKTLVIGIDGGTFDILRPLMASGQMPVLSGLMATGVHGNLESTRPPITGPAWSSFSSGCNPGKHGVIDFVEFDRRVKRVRIKEPSQRGIPSLWGEVSRQGRRVAVMGAPMTYPAQPVNGLMLTGMMTPPNSEKGYYPLDLRQKLAENGLRWIFSSGEKSNVTSLKAYSQALISDLNARVTTAEFLLQTEEPDFAVFVFDATDPLQHQYFDILTSQEDSQARQMLTAIYREMDSGIGRLMACMGEDTLVMVMSDHGFGELKGFIHLNNWLLEKGYLALREDPMTRLRAMLFKWGYTPENLYRMLRSLGLDLRRRMNRGRVYGWARRIFLSFDHVDWERTRAYALGHIGQVYLQTEGMDAVEAERLAQQLRQDLLELSHPQSGEKLIAQVFPRSELYHGPFIESAPDLILEPRGYEYVAFGESEFASNLVVGPALHKGHHRLEGILVMSGPGVRSGETISGAKIEDIMPTLLYAMGLVVPQELDGRALLEAFTPGFAAAHALHTEPFPPTPEGVVEAYNSQEAEAVWQRLKDLGYTA